jgi:hypothetical protein
VKLRIIVDSSKFVKAFGDIATPHSEALRKTITWYRQYLQAATKRKQEEFLGSKDYATK